MRFIVSAALLVTLAVSLSACSGLRFPGVYRYNIQQGNFITQEMIDQLQPGMTKRQVNYVLGTPLIMDTFHDNRWDYIYTFKARDGSSLRRQLIVYFEADQLTHFTGDYKPTPPSENEETPAPETMNPTPADMEST